MPIKCAKPRAYLFHTNLLRSDHSGKPHFQTNIPQKARTRKELTRGPNISDVLHPNRANVSKDELRQKLADIYKSGKDQVSVFGFRTQYGGGKTTGFALVYDSPEMMKKMEPHYRLVRYGIATKIEKASRKQRMFFFFGYSLHILQKSIMQSHFPAPYKGKRTYVTNVRLIEEKKPLTWFSPSNRKGTQEQGEDGTGNCQDQDCGQGQEEINGTRSFLLVAAAQFVSGVGQGEGETTSGALAFVAAYYGAQ